MIKKPTIKEIKTTTLVRQQTSRTSAMGRATTSTRLILTDGYVLGYNHDKGTWFGWKNNFDENRERVDLSKLTQPQLNKLIDLHGYHISK